MLSLAYVCLEMSQLGGLCIWWRGNTRSDIGPKLFWRLWENCPDTWLKMVNFLIILWLFWSTTIRKQVVNVWYNSCTEFSYSYWNIITPSESSSQLLIEHNGWGNISHSSEFLFPAPNLTFRNVATNQFVNCDKEMKEDNAFIEKALYT